MKIIGIDPGINGAVTCMDESGEVDFIEIIPRNAGGIDASILNDLLADPHGEIIRVYIEDVHAIYGSSAKATFTFGKVCGIIEGIVVANHIPYVYVQPKVWQKEMFQGVKEIRKPPTKKGVKGRIDTKAMSEIACKRLFPDVKFLATERCKKVHDGMTDSCLIAEYGRRRIK